CRSSSWCRSTSTPGTLPRLPGARSLVLRAPLDLSARFPCTIHGLLAPLVLRVLGEDLRYSRNDYDGLGCHRVLRDVPGHSRERRWLHRGSRRRSGLHRPRRCIHRPLPAPPAIVVGVARMPGTVPLSVTRVLALPRPTRSLSIPYARIGLVPPPALRTRTLFPHRTSADRRSPRPGAIMPPGSFLPSRPGSFFASVAAKKLPPGFDAVVNRALEKDPA